MKFGGSVLLEPSDFIRMARLIQKKTETYHRIVVVVSAMRGMTDHLIELAQAVHPQPPRREYDMLVSVGDRVSSALLAMALSQINLEAVSYTGSQSGILTSSNHSDARVIDVRPYRLISQLEAGKIVIVAGFQGVSQEKEITTLGRGGSDTTAVVLAIGLNAEMVEFYKDVDGIFEQKPTKTSFEKPIEKLSHQRAMSIVMKTGGKVVHPRAIELARLNALPLIVRSPTKQLGTLILSENIKPLCPQYESAETETCSRT